MKPKRITFMCAIMAAVFCLVGCAAIQEQARKKELMDDSADYRGLSKTEVAAYNADPKNEDKIVCTNEKPIGSNIPQRICRKESQVEQRSESDQRDMEQFLRHQRPPGPN